MASKKNKARTSRDLNPRKFKKKTSILLIEDVEYIDYKDVDLLSRFMSDRGKIRNRRVAGNTLQQQREVANAVKVAREMALLPYAKRVASTRTGGRREGRDGGGRDGRPGRDESSNEEATSDPRGHHRRRCRRHRIRRRERGSLTCASFSAPISTASASVATSSRCPMDTPATSCCPKGHALVASDGAVDQAARMRKARDTRDSSAREAATAIASKLVPMVITVPAKAGPEGKLFGSVTSGDIVAAVLDETGIELERRQLEVDTIKTIGQHTVTASLHSDVSFPIRLDVVAAE